MEAVNAMLKDISAEQKDSFTRYIVCLSCIDAAPAAARDINAAFQAELDAGTMTDEKAETYIAALEKSIFSRSER